MRAMAVAASAGMTVMTNSMATVVAVTAAKINSMAAVAETIDSVTVTQTKMI